MNVSIVCLTLLIIIKFTKSFVSEEGSGIEEEFNTSSGVSNNENASNETDEELLTFERELCPGSSLTLDQQEMIVQTHNDLRKQLATGKQRNKRGFMSTARNMYKLDWDCELEKMAADWSATCPFRYIPQTKLGSNSQLFKRFWFHFDGKSASNHINTAMHYWWKQGQEKGNDDSKNRFYAQKNYFAWANMAKGKTYRFGCSYAKCPDNQSALFVCIYNEKAQCEKEMIYEKGKPCESDKDCFTYPGSKCLVKDGLCQAPRVPNDDKSSRMCKIPHLTDLTRQWALDQHNFYRSRLAKGLEWNGETNTSQSKASQMIKMEYDCKLEEYAQAWANKCVFAHSKNYDRPNQGQNLYMSTFTHLDHRPLLHTAVEKWWQELEEFGTPADNVLTAELWELKGKAIGHYTQMAWDRTYRLGCGIANCPQMSYVVCHYGPAGNRRNNKIYEMGDPCLNDDECPIGTYCDMKSALCVISNYKYKH